MRCETCQGRGWVSLAIFPVPCPDCNGQSISHCCEGDRAQPIQPPAGWVKTATGGYLPPWYVQEQRDPGDETSAVQIFPESSGPMTLRMKIPGLTGCADDCCHPSHNHAHLRFAPHDYLVPQAVIDGVTGDLPAAERLVSEMRAGRYRIEPDTHDEWRKLNDE